MIKKWGVNWKDGMKVSSNHFMSDRNFLIEHDKEVLSFLLGDNKFGIQNRSEADEFRYSIIDEKVSIQQLKAVSRSGYMFLINELIAPNITPLSLKEINGKYENNDIIQVYVKVDISEFLDFGEVGEDEFPMRKPFASYSYKIEDMNITAALDVKSLDSYLPFAQFFKANGVIMQKTNYIPPVFNVGSDKTLKDLHFKWAEFNFELANLNSVTAQKVSDSSHGSFLKANILILSTQMAFFLADQIDEFNECYLDQSPHQMVVFYKKMARVINASLIAMKNRERIIQYMADWTDNTPQGFLEKIEEMNDLVYDHLQISESIEVVKNFISTVRSLFNRLTELNYYELQDVRPPANLLESTQSAEL